MTEESKDDIGYVPDDGDQDKEGAQAAEKKLKLI